MGALLAFLFGSQRGCFPHFDALGVESLGCAISREGGNFHPGVPSKEPTSWMVYGGMLRWFGRNR